MGIVPLASSTATAVSFAVAVATTAIDVVSAPGAVRHTGGGPAPIATEAGDDIAERGAGAGPAFINLFIVDRATAVIAATIPAIATADIDRTAAVTATPDAADVIGAGVEIGTG